MHARWKTLGALVIGGSILLGAPSARADDGAGADALATAAAERAKQGALRVAIDLYEDAYARAPRRQYLYEIGALYDQLAHAGDARDIRLAIVYLERALGGEGKTPERAAIETRLARLRTWKASIPAEPMPPRPALVPVHVLAYKAESAYEVELGPGKCSTPCTLMLPPGPAPLRANGAGKVEQQLIIPDRPASIRLQHPENGRFTAGAILLPSGLVVGGSLWALGLACRDACTMVNVIAWPTIGLGMIITGAVLMATGRHPVPPDANRVDIVARRNKLPFELTSVGLEPGPGGARGGLTFSF